jgi:Ca2+-binding RTX toxin-like protein
MRATKGKHEIRKRFAIVIGAAAVGVMALGAQTGAQTQAPTPPGQAPPTCNGLPATFVGTAADSRRQPGELHSYVGRDTFNGTPGPDVIVGLSGGDMLSGGGGNDVICGGDDKDKLIGGRGKDTLLGEAGKDVLEGGGGKDLCVGGPGKDVKRLVRRGPLLIPIPSECEVKKSI